MVVHVLMDVAEIGIISRKQTLRIYEGQMIANNFITTSCSYSKLYYTQSREQRDVVAFLFIVNTYFHSNVN